MMTLQKHTAKFPKIDLEFINTKNLPVIIGCTLTSQDKPFSIGPSRNMNPELQRTHKKELANMLKTDLEKMIYIHQTHSDKVYVMDGDNPFPTDGQLGPVGEYDAAISTVKGAQINLSIADCAGVMMYHPIENIIAAVHSGWKGTKEQISEKTIEKMAEISGGKSLSSFSEKLLVWLMPSASGKMYEVGEEFKEFFPESIKYYDGKTCFDNKTEISRRLVGLGVLEQNIMISNDCTIENNRYHSYRRDGESSGRMNAFIKLEN